MTWVIIITVNDTRETSIVSDCCTSSFFGCINYFLLENIILIHLLFYSECLDSASTFNQLLNITLMVSYDRHENVLSFFFNVALSLKIYHKEVSSTSSFRISFVIQLFYYQIIIIYRIFVKNILEVNVYKIFNYIESLIYYIYL